MRKFLIATVALVSLASAANAAPVDKAVKALYSANDAVQAAMYQDVCTGNEDGSLSDHRPSLTNDADRKAYDGLTRLIVKAFNATSGTDSAVAEVQTKFCDAAENR